MLSGSATASNHHQLGLFGQIGKSRYVSSEEYFTADLRSITVGGVVLDDLDGVGDDTSGIVLLNLENPLRNSACGPRQR